jgi:hypothetical protein
MGTDIADRAETLDIFVLGAAVPYWESSLQARAHINIGSSAGLLLLLYLFSMLSFLVDRRPWYRY